MFLKLQTFFATELIHWGLRLLPDKEVEATFREFLGLACDVFLDDEEEESED